MMKSVLIAGAFGAVIVTLLGSTFTSFSSQIFPSNTMLSTAATGFAIGASIQIAVRLTGVS